MVLETEILSTSKLSRDAVDLVVNARHPDPFSVLGPHAFASGEETIPASRQDADLQGFSIGPAARGLDPEPRRMSPGEPSRGAPAWAVRRIPEPSRPLKSPGSAVEDR